MCTRGGKLTFYSVPKGKKNVGMKTFFGKNIVLYFWIETKEPVCQIHQEIRDTLL